MYLQRKEGSWHGPFLDLLVFQIEVLHKMNNLKMASFKEQQQLLAGCCVLFPSVNAHEQDH